MADQLIFNFFIYSFYVQRPRTTHLNVVLYESSIIIIIIIIYNLVQIYAAN